MLGKRYIKINNEGVPNPTDFDYSFDEDETVSMSEAGTELVRVRRLDKRTFKATWQVSSFWLKKFEDWCKEPTVTVTYQGNDFTCRMRGFGPKLAENSEYVETSDGLWTITLTMTEI